MSMPLSIRLDDAVRAELEMAARESGKGLSTLIRDALTDLATEMRRARIRKASEAVAAHVAADPEARAFFTDWGTPTTDV
jgi:predicted transcriptional regulator